MLHLAIFVSGTGSNFRAIHNAVQNGTLDATIALVVASKPGIKALEYAVEHGIPVHVQSKSAGTAAILDTLMEHSVDFIALAGYMRLVEPEIVQKYNDRILNIHPALLPAFGGKGMYGKHVHEAVLSSGAKLSGATVHVVNEEFDRGPIVLQRAVPVLDDDDAESLAARVLKIEHALYPEALQLFAQGRVDITGIRTRITNYTPTIAS